MSEYRSNEYRLQEEIDQLKRENDKLKGKRAENKKQRWKYVLHAPVIALAEVLAAVVFILSEFFELVLAAGMIGFLIVLAAYDNHQDEEQWKNEIKPVVLEQQKAFGAARYECQEQEDYRLCEFFFADKNPVIRRCYPEGCLVGGSPVKE